MNKFECTCKNIEMGSYGNQVELPTPDFLNMYLKKHCEYDLKTICVDHCLKDHILELWDYGIPTLGCCCGHGRMTPSILIPLWYMDNAKRIGYKNINPYSETIALIEVI